MGIIATVAFFVLPGVFANASTKSVDISGTWDCSCYGLFPSDLVFYITSNTDGALMGRVEWANATAFPVITGSVDGENVKIIATYTPNSPKSYVIVFVGTIMTAPNGDRVMQGSWSNNRLVKGIHWTAKQRVGAMSTKMPINATEPVLRIIDFKNINDKNKKLGQPPGPAKLEYFRDGKWQRASVDTTLRIGDKLRTDDTTVAVFEFLIGGRVGINKGVEIEITGDRSIKEGVINVKKEIGNIADIIIDILHSGTGHQLQVQLNGRAMSIKG